MTVELTILGLISLLGCVYDWKIRKIPNWLTLGSSFLIILLSTIFKTNGLLNSVSGFLVGIALLFIPYLFGAMGAGDVKLLGALGAIVGVKEVVVLFFYSAICGLFLGLIWMCRRPGNFKFLITTGQILPVVDKSQKLPYGLAIFMGTILYIIFKSTNLFNFGNFLLWQ